MKLAGAKCTHCSTDISDKCLVTIVPLIRVIQGKLVEMPTPLVFTPMECPNCHEAMLRVEDEEKSPVEIPEKGLYVATR